ncbi:hypothetical protein BDP27DRAFT_1320738 [Rhodocollybia butyracea]|uniref:Uncharacterized protein n=1 Tax=Rhodocollybia butyracea TaxID=206335 RepID=A0A9P5UAS3_9AGAR|nr:hypothetical protein BDP27DRAFT_1320738 [Rhodocollybia butyracea]
MPSHQPVDVDYVTDLVHRQGGELLRVRGELEESQKMRDILINASRSMGKQLNNLYKTSIQWHLRLESMTQEFAALKTGSEAFLAELDAARTGFDTDLRSVALGLVHPSENVSDEISSVSDFSVSSLGTANVEKDDNYEKVVPPSLGLNLNPAERSTESKNIPATQEAGVTATPMRVASVREELENYAAREDRSDSSLTENSEAPKECGANAITSGTIPVSNGTHEVFSTATQFSLNSTGASSSLNPIINETYEHFSIADMNPVCTKLPKSKAVKTMCQTVIGNPAQIPTHILKHPEALFVLPNSWHHTLVTVSREANDLCTALKKSQSQLARPFTCSEQCYWLSLLSGAVSRRGQSEDNSR